MLAILGDPKCHMVQTPTGRISVVDIEPGASICDTEGGVQQVLGVHRQRDVLFYRMEFSDETHILCCADHTWLAWRSHVRRRKRSIDYPEGSIFGKASARKYLPSDLIAEMKKGRRYRIPLCEPVNGQFNRYKINPYALGVYLGDGHMPARGGCIVALHQDDIAILERLAEDVDGFTIKPDSQRPTMVVGRLSTRSPDHARLRDLGLLGKRAWEKNLPVSACHAPVAWRWELLRGLMDTDGWVEKKRGAYYTSTSPRLRDGVANLARSLGCFVTLTEKHPTYTLHGEKHKGRPAWTLRIKSATPDKLFWISRKREIAVNLHHQSLAKEITSIEEWDVSEGACLEVNHPNSLYLIDDYTVTHNTIGHIKLGSVSV